jgi:hypothetical protein
MYGLEEVGRVLHKLGVWKTFEHLGHLGDPRIRSKAPSMYPSQNQGPSLAHPD